MNFKLMPFFPGGVSISNTVVCGKTPVCGMANCSDIRWLWYSIKSVAVLHAPASLSAASMNDCPVRSTTSEGMSAWYNLASFNTSVAFCWLSGDVGLVAACTSWSAHCLVPSLPTVSSTLFNRSSVIRNFSSTFFVHSSIRPTKFAFSLVKLFQWVKAKSATATKAPGHPNCFNLRLMLFVVPNCCFGSATELARVFDSISRCTHSLSFLLRPIIWTSVVDISALPWHTTYGPKLEQSAPSRFLFLNSQWVALLRLFYDNKSLSVHILFSIPASIAGVILIDRYTRQKL